MKQLKPLGLYTHTHTHTHTRNLIEKIKGCEAFIIRAIKDKLYYVKCT